MYFTTTGLIFSDYKEYRRQKERIFTYFNFMSKKMDFWKSTKTWFGARLILIVSIWGCQVALKKQKIKNCLPIIWHDTVRLVVKNDCLSQSTERNRCTVIKWMLTILAAWIICTFIRESFITLLSCSVLPVTHR